MDTFHERAARVILLAVGLSAVLMLLALPPADGAATPLLLHHQFLIGLVGAALLAAVLVRSIRPAAVAIGLLSQAGFAAIALSVPGFSASAALYLNLGGLVALLCAGLLLVQAARQQARWDGLLPRRTEA
jgi:peptidoglycan/LPS O-acetylase OafA/YrhL